MQPDGEPGKSIGKCSLAYLAAQSSMRALSDSPFRDQTRSKTASSSPLLGGKCALERLLKGARLRLSVVCYSMNDASSALRDLFCVYHEPEDSEDIDALHSDELSHPNQAFMPEDIKSPLRCRKCTTTIL